MGPHHFLSIDEVIPCPEKQEHDGSSEVEKRCHSNMTKSTVLHQSALPIGLP